ncbi:hypothetical protein E4P41_15515 [Geodermatophilus sp. DF01-2]|uniref:hypothetical protein n=1 Tax=Geodermatophilus sp. DF01-2 TaxID=2559610 RepID=UPI0010743AC9|nr:hypothetical protein [Geodermatophilus sp. DF01_2]TFV56663.1 hypothetical protein E4P41_15515 [Geodermatophilus sp. DF01_2]
MSLEQDVAAARRAVDALEAACTPLTRHFGDTVDARRLTIDVARLRDDLTLLCGAARGRQVLGAPPSPAVLWDDGYDAGTGGSGRTNR